MMKKKKMLSVVAALNVGKEPFLTAVYF